MRAILVVAVTALGLAFVGTSPTSAAPVNGGVIGHAATINQVVDQAHGYGRPWWRRHHHRHHDHKRCFWHRGHYHCVWW